MALYGSCMPISQTKFKLSLNSLTLKNNTNKRVLRISWLACKTDDIYMHMPRELNGNPYEWMKDFITSKI